MRVVDLFAGWGGATLGAQMAGAQTVLAVNHCPLAVQAHVQNHPGVKHVCQDVRSMDWRDLPEYDLLLAGPSCPGFSSAGQPRRTGGVQVKHAEMRETVWSVLDCIKATLPNAFIVENVKGFWDWDQYPQWRAELVRLGYGVEERLVNAAHHGVPQLRERLFVVGTRGRAPELDLPGSKILRREGRPVVQGAAPRAPAFGPCISWRSGTWKKMSDMLPRYHKARARLEAARALHGGRCIVHHGWHGHKGLPLSEPLRTITTGNQWVVVDKDRYRPLTRRENARGMGFPDWYTWPASANRKDTIRGLGNAWVPAVGAALVRCLMKDA